MINNVDKYLEIANKIKKENGLNDDYCAMISMLKNYHKASISVENISIDCSKKTLAFL